MNMELMNTFTNEQLTMCEKKHLINYIIELRTGLGMCVLSNNSLNLFIEERCTPSPAVQLVQSHLRASTCFEDLYFEYKQWCFEYGHNQHTPDRQTIKGQLLRWQKDSEYGLAVGKDMKEGKPNGSVRKPYFNLVVKDEDE